VTAPYRVTASNTSLISSPGTIAGNIFTVDPDSTCTGAVVTLTVTDSAAKTATANVSITTPGALISPDKARICEIDNSCAAGTATQLLTLSGVSPFSITSSDPFIIANSGAIAGYSYTVNAIDGSLEGTTDVTLTLTDACSQTSGAIIRVIHQGGIGGPADL